MGNWPLTLNACDDLCPWFFAFGHTNYAHWTPVFLKDVACLPDTHPSVHEAFMEGKFVVQRSDKKFSLMALDQSQEHSIKFLELKDSMVSQRRKRSLSFQNLRC